MKQLRACLIFQFPSVPVSCLCLSRVSPVPSPALVDRVGCFIWELSTSRAPSNAAAKNTSGNKTFLLPPVLYPYCPPSQDPVSSWSEPHFYLSSRIQTRPTSKLCHALWLAAPPILQCWGPLTTHTIQFSFRLLVAKLLDDYITGIGFAFAMRSSW